MFMSSSIQRIYSIINEPVATISCVFVCSCKCVCSCIHACMCAHACMCMLAHARARVCLHVEVRN